MVWTVSRFVDIIDEVLYGTYVGTMDGRIRWSVLSDSFGMFFFASVIVWDMLPLFFVCLCNCALYFDLSLSRL